MKAILSAMAASVVLFAGAALASPVRIAPVTFDAKFQEKIDEDYGAREGERLSKEIAQQLERALAKAGHAPSVDAPVSIAVTIVDAIPNKPTFQQLTDTPRLDFFRSFGVGGATLRGRIVDARGATVREFEHRWYETDIRWAQTAGVWTDADRAIRGFTRKAAEAVSSPAAPASAPIS